MVVNGIEKDSFEINFICTHKKGDQAHILTTTEKKSEFPRGKKTEISIQTVTII